jgi:hypothetical protein
VGFFSRILGARPPQLSVVVHEAFEGAIRIFETPRGNGWQYREDARQGDGFTVMVLKYWLPATPAPLTLLAKIYTHDPGVAQDPLPPDWRNILGPLFSSIATVETRQTSQTTMSGSLPACEAVIDGEGSNPVAPLRLRERRAVLGHELFIVGAVGPPDLFASQAEDIEKWFESSAFVPVDEAK